MPGIAPVAEHLGVEPSTRLLKCIAFDVDGELGLALVPGDREVNEYALAAAVAPKSARLYGDDDFAEHPELPKGYIGPHHPDVAVVVADPSVAAPVAWVTGANETDHHVRNAVLGRDFTRRRLGRSRHDRLRRPLPALREPALGRPRHRGRARVPARHQVLRGARRASTPTSNGEQHPMLMGCYGIGISRIVAAVAEEFHDEHGLAWPAALAPYDVHLIALPGRGDASGRRGRRRSRSPLRGAAGRRDLACSTTIATRSPGVKFADADLVGVPGAARRRREGRRARVSSNASAARPANATRSRSATSCADAPARASRGIDRDVAAASADRPDAREADARAAAGGQGLVRAEVGRLPLHRVPRRRRPRPAEPEQQAAAALLPRAAGPAARTAARTGRRRRRARRRERTRPRLRRAAAAPAPGRIAHQQARGARSRRRSSRSTCSRSVGRILVRAAVPRPARPPRVGARRRHAADPRHARDARPRHRRRLVRALRGRRASTASSPSRSTTRTSRASAGC